MPPVRFVHAADLHLDAAFPGMARDVSPDLARRLHEATFTALNRLVALCEEEKPDFLILAGDTYNHEDLSLRAQIAVRDACEKLGRLGVRVFLVHGNHDPFSSRLQTLRWPDNVTAFGPQVSSALVPGPGGRPLAVVHGVSHFGPKESRNLATWFHRVETEQPCPQIGVLHTSLGTADGEAVYAPCSLADLAEAGLDYWALGHAHEYAILGRDPLVVYPGSAQGLHINEQGPHGCVLVALPAPGEEGAGEPVVEFRPLAPVAWQVLSVSLEAPAPPQAVPPGDEAAEAAEAAALGAPDSLPALERFLREKMDEALAAVWPGCETVVLRLRLTGRTPLDAELRRLSVRNDLCEALREGGEDGVPGLWIKDVEVETRAAFDRDVARRREDLLGETLRRADAWRANPELLALRADEALGDLFSKGRSRKLLPSLTAGEMLDLLAEAERLCADTLES